MKIHPYTLLAMLLISGLACAVEEHLSLTEYTGPETCVACHEAEARHVQQTVHYRGHGLPTHASPMGGVWRTDDPSKWNANTVNNYCTNPAMMSVDAKSDTLNDVCLKCHIGAGLPPTAEPTPEQLNNIDCLMCHSEDYTRVGVRDENGELWFEPAGTDAEVLQMARTLQGEPTKKACLKCHAYAGGGDGVKTSLNSAFADPEGKLDVHMKRDRFTCSTCHHTSNHKFRGRGLHIVDADDGAPLNCRSCHGDVKHEKHEEGGHLEFLDCSVCHIPFVGREVPIEVYRDFEGEPHLTASGDYHPASEKALNVVPKYMFRNGPGDTLHYVAGMIPSVFDADGRVVLTMPDPSASGESKLVPVIRHFTNHPHDVLGRPMIPNMALFFATGDIDSALASATTFFDFWSLLGPFSYFDETVMNIQASHGVSSMELKCLACHTDGERRNNLMEAGLTPTLDIEQ